ncbi:MAG: hypothetical protein GY870_17480 [archaeon]|nr:hypothetical protein [archaeon]
MNEKTTKRKYISFSVIIAYAIFMIIYVILFLGQVPFYNFIIVGSVAAVSTGTLYTVVAQSYTSDRRIKTSKYKQKPKSKTLSQNPKRIKQISKERSPDILEEYLDAFPYIEEYTESDKTHDEFPVMKEFIFSNITPEETEKINLLGLSEIDKIQFIREMLYYDPEERETLIENMLMNRDKIEEEVIYSPPVKTIELGDKFRIHVISLIEPGEKKKIKIIESTDSIDKVKESVGILFDYDLEAFLLSSGGLILKEGKKISDYDIIDEDEIVLIPTRK